MPTLARSLAVRPLLIPLFFAMHQTQLKPAFIRLTTHHYLEAAWSNSASWIYGMWEQGPFIGPVDLLIDPKLVS
jgi:hypothetical protein